MLKVPLKSQNEVTLKVKLETTMKVRSDVSYPGGGCHCTRQ